MGYDRCGSKAKPIDHWCRRCGTHFQSAYPRHFYCEPCSTSADLLRKRLGQITRNVHRRRDIHRDTGKKISAEIGHSLADPPQQPNLKWRVAVTVPFCYSGSKNAVWALRAKGHVALRREAKAYREAIILAIRSALHGIVVVQNKLWLDIHVEKSNHKGDAVNFVDTICDAVKVATGLDDRWFCIRNLDWSIGKNDPGLFIGLGQEECEPAQACSYCGRLLPFTAFVSNRSNKNGITRICRDCKRTRKPKGCVLDIVELAEAAG